MSKNPQYNQQSKSEIEEIYDPYHGNWPSQHLATSENKYLVGSLPERILSNNI